MNTLTSSRENFADELRGFALLGIVLVNAPFLGISMQGFTQASLLTVADKLAAFAVVAFAQAKFYLLFAFLFGYSLSFVIKENNPQSITQFKRRLAGLGVIGVLHAIFFFLGDILLMYALFGCILLWLQNKSNTTVRRVIMVAISLWLLLLTLALIGAWFFPDDGKPLEEIQIFDAALKSSGFVDTALARLKLYPIVLLILFTVNSLSVLAMFGIGLLAGRQKLLAEPDKHHALWRRGGRYGLLIGLPLALVSAYLSVGPGAMLDAPTFRETFGVVIGFVTAPLLTWGYVSWLAQLRHKWPNLLQWCRHAGRMSLTGYLCESIVLSLIFCGYGLAWFGKLGAANITLIALTTWLVIDALAHLWQRKFQYGPFEWMLRIWVWRTPVR
jgi:uncharacterized protein